MRRKCIDKGVKNREGGVKNYKSEWFVNGPNKL